jgi:hypothetical protein
MDFRQYVDQTHISTFPGHHQGCGSANAPRRTGDQDHLSFE